MEDKKEQGIFIPFEIWTIKNLNINEKLVLSDIYNKSLLNEFSGYNKKTETLAEDLFLDAYTVKNIFNSLQKKGYIGSNPEIHRNQGTFKKSLSRRYIKQENFKETDRFIISESNIFYRNGVQGIYFSNKDIRFLNNWKKSGERKIEQIRGIERKLFSKNRKKHLILFLIIKKISFFHGELYNNLFARFSIKDIVEFTGIERKTIGIYIKELISIRTYNSLKIRFLYKLSDDNIYNELFNKLEDTTILTDYRKNTKEIEVNTIDGETKIVSVGNMENLYYINLCDMEKIGIDVISLLNNKK